MSQYCILEIVRHLQPLDEDLERFREIPVKTPFHIVYIAPRPGKLKALAASDKARLLNLRKRKKIELDEISPATYKEFVDYLRDIDKDIPYVFHFDGHGGKSSKGEIFLEFEKDEDGLESIRVSAEMLGRTLASSKISLAFISACYSAALPYSQNSIIEQLFMAGIPAIVGMQSETGAGQREMPSFVQSFYTALAEPEKYPTLVDAMAHGRAALTESRFWYGPVLYLRSGDDEGRLFKPVK